MNLVEMSSMKSSRDCIMLIVYMYSRRDCYETWTWDLVEIFMILYVKFCVLWV